VASVRIPLIIDCDPGIDDAIALLLALASPEVDLLGVTTVAGNAPVERTTANALRILQFAGRPDVPVAAGADRPLVRRRPFVAGGVHGEDGLGGVSLDAARAAPAARHAIDFVAETAFATSTAITLATIAPLTNIALLLARYPDVAERIGRVVVMGGSMSGGNVTAAAEFNVWFDPEAAERVLDSGLDMTMVGLDVTHRAVLRPEDTERIRHSGRVGAVVAAMLDHYSGWHRDVYGSADLPMHDPLAVAEAILPGTVVTEQAHVRVELDSDLSRGATVVDRWRFDQGEPNARVAVDVDRDAFAAMLMERLALLDS
jgi:pyrimidine-specific ribonucleoside hydrolase